MLFASVQYLFQVKYWGCLQAELVLDFYEIGNVIEEVVDLSKLINLEVDSDDVRELLGFHNQKIDELTEMYEQDIEELGVFRPSSIRRSNDDCEFDRRSQFN
ncbi:hypothetical protein TNCV_879041 [Trichonephila clavipes]|nr:hypothetical protein TNCV_879041 [Trichonephila clavipes]